MSAIRKFAKISHKNQGGIKTIREVKTIPEMNYYKPTRKGECGISNIKIYFPMFMMGCCGDERGVVQVAEYVLEKEVLDWEVFEGIATYLKKNGFWDWDWASFRKNVIIPNREHIKAALSLTEEGIERFIRDGDVVLNHWFYDKSENEGLTIQQYQEENDGMSPLCAMTFFYHKKVDY